MSMVSAKAPARVGRELPNVGCKVIVSAKRVYQTEEDTSEGQLQIFPLPVVTRNIHDRGDECWRSSGGGLCFRNPFWRNNGRGVLYSLYSV